MEEDRTESATLDEYDPQDPQEHEDHWVECATDSGEVYFSNTVTGETSWTIPGSNSAPPEQYGTWIGEAAESSAIRGENTNWEELGAPAEASIKEYTVLDEAGEAAQWLELYDPSQQTVYYFSPGSGEVRWERPLEATAVVQSCDTDAVLNTVVSLQSAARAHHARARVAAIREEKAREQNKLEHIQQVEDVIIAEDPVVQSEDSQWVEVYDPATQQQYYYSPRTSETSWSPPHNTVSSSDERKEAAAISIQSLSRGRFARKQVHELREQSAQRSGLENDESECEAMQRLEMNQQELLQLSGGDLFWGLDNFEHELMRNRIEEEMAGDFNKERPLDVNMQLDFFEFEEEKVDTERLQREQLEEHEARLAMSCEEAQQCQNGDSFWGIQAEEVNQHTANAVMAQEEAASRRFADDVVQQALSATWEAEVLQNATKELAERGGLEQRVQEKYLRWFYGQCVSVDELLHYRWPNKQDRLEEVASPAKKRRSPAVQSHLDAVASATPYPLDDLVIRERLEHGDLRYGHRSILTVHHQSSCGSKTTHFEIIKASPECAFDETTAAALVTNADQRVNGDDGSLDGLNDRSADESQGSSINYRRSRTPDPHLPARFNGVPYKPNQISPTREILSGDHRKLNQLPSLTKGKLSADTLKIRNFQKAKTKARANAKKTSAPAPVSNNTSDSGSVREQETDREPEDAPRAQFKRQEHQVLSKLFALMDLDASGTVNQNEMRWALQRDAEIHALAQTSPLLRILLKQRTRLEALFSNHAAEDTTSSSSELSWEEFLVRCEDAYLQLMSEGFIQPDAAAMTDTRAQTNEPTKSKTKFRENYPEPSARETEAQTIRRVFALLDNDGNGVVDVAEVQRTLYSTATVTSARPNSTGVVSKELRALVEGSKALQPMLHQELFMTAFTKFEPMDPRGISEEEFVAFCLEIAQVAAANNMVSVQ